MAGFSLIELLVVMAIIGIGVGFSINLMQHSTPKTRVENAARSIQSVLYQARLMAVRRAASVAVRFEPTEQRAVAYYLDSGTELRSLDLRLDTGTRFVQFEGPVSEPAITGFTDLGGGVYGAVFERSGTLRDPGSVRLVHTGYADYLEVCAATQSGVIELRKYLKDADSPTGTAGFFPKATHPVTGQAVWVWYGEG